MSLAQCVQEALDKFTEIEAARPAQLPSATRKRPFPRSGGGGARTSVAFNYRDNQIASLAAQVQQLQQQTQYAIGDVDMSLIVPEKFQHIHRVMNTNIDGNRKVPFALTSIKGVGRRFAFVVCRKADVDIHRRAGELSEADMDRLTTIMQNPSQYKIPNWFLNRQKDIKDGKYSQVLSTAVDNKLREDFERLKKIRLHRGLRHFWGLRVRGQHTKTTGRKGRTVGVSKKKGG
ncbi:hypothetical protein QR680_004572 [Steinernema hermaphroditum]|uniref:Small ribosomal subunit protein uS13 n=2 Tax=Steinernema TaxID=34507 RepID=A0AA39HP51_9BILA|nr:hypothetical protein QR680_004572 [Steinernema hermaphroditum]